MSLLEGTAFCPVDLGGPSWIAMETCALLDREGGGGPRYVAIMSERAVARTNISVDSTRYVAMGEYTIHFFFC